MPLVPTPPPAVGLSQGLPAGYVWVDRGNTTPIDTQLMMGQTADALIIGPSGASTSIVGIAQAGGQGSVSFTHVPDGTWNASIGPVTLPLSYVVPRPVPAGSGFAQPG